MKKKAKCAILRMGAPQVLIDVKQQKSGVLRLRKAQTLTIETTTQNMEIFTLDQLWERIERAEAMANEKVNADDKEQQVNNNVKKGEQHEV